MERIWGPLNGFYLAAYSEAVDEGERYTSYAKVCWTRPDSYWDADCAFKIFGGEHHRSPEGALMAVEIEARNEISHLPRRVRALVERRQRRRVALPRLLATALFRQRLA